MSDSNTPAQASLQPIPVPAPGSPEDPRTMILQSCRALFASGQVVELRILGLPGIKGRFPACGWFNDFEKLADVAADFDRNKKPEGIYATLNPVHDACLARSVNSVKEFCKVATTKKDILRRQWFPIDIDPAGRPIGVSSTEEEIAHVREVARSIRTWIEGEMGFPPGIAAFSGNGVHLLYRIELLNTEETERTIKNCLIALGERFSTEGKRDPGQPQCKIDRVNFNADRIFKLYGTKARKGEDTKDRPHRRSHLFAINGTFPLFDELPIVPGRKLEELAALAVDALPASPPAQARKKQGASTPAVSTGDDIGRYAVNLDAFIAQHGIEVRTTEPFDGTGLRYMLDHCVFDSAHTGTSAILGRSNSGAIFYKCQHDTCSGKTWKDVCQLFEGKPVAAAVSAGPAPQPTGPAPKPSKSKNGEPDGDDPWGLAGSMMDEEFTDPDTGHIMLRRHRQVFYQYSPARRKYMELTDDTIRVNVTRFLGDRVDRVSNRKVSDVINCLGAMATVPSELEIPFTSKVDSESRCGTGDPARYHRITLANGILDLDMVLAGKSMAECLQSHTPEWFSTTSLPFAFPVTEEQGVCPTWLAFLGDIFDNDSERIAILQEAFGCCFMEKNVHESFFVLHGAGRNGKSTALKVLETLLGEENVSSLSVEQLADRYLINSLYGKLANICSDMNEMDRVQEGLLKAVVSEEPIAADRKYKDSIKFRPRARLFFATNVLPRFTDTSLGIWRRMVLLPFDMIVSEDRVDFALSSKLRKEMPGIFLWALQGMIRLSQQGRFTKSERCDEALREYRLSCFPILMFLDECTVLLEGYQTSVGDLWDAYREWCRVCGLSKPKPVHQFGKDVLGFLASKITWTRSRGGQEYRMQLHGIAIRSDAPRLTNPPEV